MGTESGRTSTGDAEDKETGNDLKAQRRSSSHHESRTNSQHKDTPLCLTKCTLNRLIPQSWYHHEQGRVFLQQKHLLSPNATPPYPHMPHMPQTRTTCLTRTCKSVCSSQPHVTTEATATVCKNFIRNSQTAQPASIANSMLHPSINDASPHEGLLLRQGCLVGSETCLCFGFSRVSRGADCIRGVKAAQGAADHCTAVCTPSVPTLCVRRLLHRQTRQASLWAAVCAAVGRLARAFSCRLSHL